MTMTSKSIKSVIWKQISLGHYDYNLSGKEAEHRWTFHSLEASLAGRRYVQMTELQMEFLSSFQGGNIGLAVHWLVRYRVLCGRAQ